jgi:hypothetical protein
MKSPLAERPIFHQLKERVRAHIFLCVLAYHLLVAIEKTLQDRGVHSSWATVREMLKTPQVVTMVLPTADARILKIRCAQGEGFFETEPAASLPPIKLDKGSQERVPCS